VLKHLSYFLFGWAGWFNFYILLLKAANGKDYYWLGAYPMLVAAGGVWLKKATIKRLWILYAAITVMIASWLPIIPLILLVFKPAGLAAYYKRFDIQKTGTLHWDDLKDHELPQDFADMKSWQELGNKVSAVYASLPDSTKKYTMLYCLNYALNGAVTYYGKNFPTPLSNNASFLFWMPDTFRVNNLLFVANAYPSATIGCFSSFKNILFMTALPHPWPAKKA